MTTARQRAVDHYAQIERERQALATVERLEAELEIAVGKAWDSLARYKFLMAGYHAAQVVLLRRVAGLDRTPNPFADLVKLARRKRAGEALTPNPETPTP